MSEFSRPYAEAYDVLYADKDYAAEAAYVTARLRGSAPDAATILEFGSGTGRHARLLAQRGFAVTGIERSQSMIALARASDATNVTLVEGDMRTTAIGQTVDAVIALFHVISYLETDRAIADAFRNARQHLEPGGLFLFDFWYGPAVLTQKPETRVKSAESPLADIVRTARTTLDPEQNLARVDYTLFTRTKGETHYRRIDEVHVLRYLFLPELRALLASTGFRLVDAEEWLSGGPLGLATWSAAVLATAVA